MSVYVLDTDCLTLLLYGHPEMSRQAAVHDPAEMGLTIVTVEETLTGWYGFATHSPKTLSWRH